jgi:hypothetical protein
MKTEHFDNNSDIRRKTPINKSRAIIDLVMLLSLIIMTLSAVLILPCLYDCFFDFFQVVGFKIFSYIHDISGFVFLGAVIIHIVLSWKRFMWFFRRKKI